MKREINKLKKCKFCEKLIHQDLIRCKDCNEAWIHGHQTGIDEVKTEMKNIFNGIINPDLLPPTS